MIVYGMAMGFVQFGLLYPAIKLGLPAGLASLVMQSQAFFTLALAVVFLGERPLPSQIVGAIVAFGGLAVIGVERMTAAALIPLLMGVGSAIARACGSIVNRRIGGECGLLCRMDEPCSRSAVGAAFAGGGGT